MFMSQRHKELQETEFTVAYGTQTIINLKKIVPPLLHSKILVENNSVSCVCVDCVIVSSLSSHVCIGNYRIWWVNFDQKKLL
jgi:hypothetical protein